jgi:dihydrofolate reductase
VGRIVATYFITLDGVVEAPERWQGDVGSDDLWRVISGNNDASEAFLMGRRLYDEWARHWPAVGDEDFYARYVNHVPKYVVSSTLTDPGWAGTTMIRDAAGVRALKESTEKQVSMFGSATTARWLLGEGLLDELCLITHPVSVGTGDRLLDGVDRSLDLLSCEPIDRGLVVLRYAPA